MRRPPVDQGLGRGLSQGLGQALGQVRTQALALVLGSLAMATGAQAPYKVVGPDGRVTYTDRPPAQATDGRAQAVRLPTTALGQADPLATLPMALREPVRRYPVTLYTGPDCNACERARVLLRQRGVPYTERVAHTDADADALQRLTGGRSIPTLSVGRQVLRGLQEADWLALLDLAAYPKEPLLPRGWNPAPPQAVAAAAPAEGPGGAPRTGGAAPAAPSPVPPQAGSEAPAVGTPRIRF